MLSRILLRPAATRSRSFRQALILGLVLCSVHLTSLAGQSPDPAGPADDPVKSDEEGKDDEIIIEGVSEKQDSYFRRTAPGVVKSDIPLMDVPQAVQVVPNQVIEDQRANALFEVARNVSNAQPNVISALGLGDGLLLRGFQAPLYMVDGQPNQVAQISVAPREMRQFSRVEILKGASSMTFGTIEPGGVVNLVTKKPLADPYYEAELAYGSGEYVEGVADLTGPLNEDRTLLYRLIAVGRKQDSWRDPEGSPASRAFVAPAFSWLLTPDTTLTLFGHYQNDVIRSDRGISAVFDSNTAALREEYADRAPLIARQAFPAKELFPDRYRLEDAVYSDRYFGNRERESDEQVQGSGGFEIESDWGNWVLRNRTRGESVGAKTQRTLATGLRTDNRTLDRQFERRSVYAAHYNTTFSATGKIKTGRWTHRPHLGLDFTHLFLRIRSEEFYRDAGSKDLFLTDAERSVFENLNRPNPAEYFLLTNFDSPISLRSINPLNIKFAAEFNNTGLYGQYNLSFNESWHFLVGARYDQVRGLATDESFSTRLLVAPFVAAAAKSLLTFPQRTRANADHVSPRGGLLFRPIEQVSFFVSAAENFTQDFSVLRGSRDTARPTLATSYEGGVKLELFKKQLVATVTGFEIRKTNIVVQDPLNVNRLIQTGEQTHRGGEFDVLATPIAGLNLIASVGYVDAKITKDETIDPETGKKLLEGKRPANVAKYNANAWIVYEFQSGFLRGFGLGGGASYVSEREATGENDLTLPQYTIANGVVYYRASGLKASVNFKNIYNQRYILAGNTAQQLIPGRPFEFIASLQMKF